jgi:hypothetical protein
MVRKMDRVSRLAAGNFSNDTEKAIWGRDAHKRHANKSKLERDIPLIGLMGRDLRRL